MSHHKKIIRLLHVSTWILPLNKIHFLIFCFYISTHRQQWKWRIGISRREKSSQDDFFYVSANFLYVNFPQSHFVCLPWGCKKRWDSYSHLRQRFSYLNESAWVDVRWHSGKCLINDICSFALGKKNSIRIDKLMKLKFSDRDLTAARFPRRVI